jgi:hypothetical protein
VCSVTIDWVETENGHSFIQINQYAFARSIVGLYGGVLEALLTDRLSATGKNTLGALITLAYKKGLLILGTNLCALCTIILYFRNNFMQTELQQGRPILSTYILRGI